MDFTDFFTTYKPEIIKLGLLIAQPLAIFFISLVLVWAVGWMYSMVKSANVKNTIATLSIIGLNIAYKIIFLPEAKSATEFLTIATYSWICLINISISLGLYIAIGMRLFDRVDDWQDRHFGRDKPYVPPKPKKDKTRPPKTKAKNNDNVNP